ncbi:MAG: hypothetical protein K9H64_19210 [Bacteroidales bacterium]|nr:hypothetical protein [Bacteroidales bacterium]MCF8458168.1 hypothetical protein [Bacteroidales bacterium]
MKRLFILLCAAVFILGFASCKKCTTCEIRKLDGTVEASYDEFCGSKKDIDDFKKSLEAKKELFLGANGQVICTEK